MISAIKLKKTIPKIEFSAKFTSPEASCFKKILQKKLPKASKVIPLNKLDKNISVIFFDLDFNFKTFTVKTKLL